MKLRSWIEKPRATVLDALHNSEAFTLLRKRFGALSDLSALPLKALFGRGPGAAEDAGRSQPPIAKPANRRSSIRTARLISVQVRSHDGTQLYARVRNVSQDGLGMAIESVFPLPLEGTVHVALENDLIPFRVVRRIGRTHGIRLERPRDAAIVCRSLGLS